MKSSSFVLSKFMWKIGWFCSNLLPLTQSKCMVAESWILVADTQMYKRVVVSLAVKRWTEGCYNVTMPLKASKDTKMQRKTVYEFSVGNSMKTNTNVFCARCVANVFYFSAILGCTLLLLRLLACMWVVSLSLSRLHIRSVYDRSDSPLCQ